MQEMGGVSYYADAVVKGPRLEIPLFDCEDPIGWLQQCEKFFDMSGTPYINELILNMMLVANVLREFYKHIGMPRCMKMQQLLRKHTIKACSQSKGVRPVSDFHLSLYNCQQMTGRATVIKQSGQLIRPTELLGNVGTAKSRGIGSTYAGKAEPYISCKR